jgi:hypothetical protein
MDTPTLQINGEEYSFVKKRNQEPVSIYKGRDCYLRIGPREIIEREVNHHKKLFEYGFPIPLITEEGEFRGLSYFKETSLGDEHFGQIFRSRQTKNLEIPDADFEMLLDVVRKFTDAQVKTIHHVETVFDPSSFEDMIHVDIIQDELPHLSDKTRMAMDKAHKHISQFPLVLTHGDFNPYNILPGGVIDWERGSYTPLGYDSVTCLSQTLFFPLPGDFEFCAGYRFSEKQTQMFFEDINRIYALHNLPQLGNTINDFIFARSIWSVVRMQRWPKLKAWRDTLYEKLIEAYLEERDLMKFLSTYER